jgi:hypothetical protein
MEQPRGSTRLFSFWAIACAPPAWKLRASCIERKYLAYRGKSFATATIFTTSGTSDGCFSGAGKSDALHRPSDFHPPKRTS